MKNAERTGGTNAANGLVRNPEAIQALAKICKNPNLAKYDLAPEMLAKVKSWGNSNIRDISYADVINLMDEFIRNAEAKNIEILNGKYLFARFVHDNPQDMQAAYWIMEDIISDGNTFKNSTIKIEHLISDGRVDVFRINPPLYIEYKWYSGSATVSKSEFLKQFVGRDLKADRPLTALQWRMKGNKLSKDDLLGYLLSTEGKAALNELPEQRKAAIFFPSYNKWSGVTDANVRDFVNSNYSIIFK